MFEDRLRPLGVYAVILAVVALLGARWLNREEPASAADAGSRPAAIELRSQGGGRVTVHVAGAVRRPGVYRLAAGARVDDAVARAGGPTRRADTTQINLAAKVEDGRQVLVPPRATAAATPSVASSAAPEMPLNLNTATLEQLEALEGIGPGTAQQILEYRDAHDGFGSVDELGQVPGIGDVRLASLREQVRL